MRDDREQKNPVGVVGGMVGEAKRRGAVGMKVGIGRMGDGLQE